MEGDTRSTTFTVTSTVFQSTPSAWRETPISSAVKALVNVFQSTPSAWRETRCCFYVAALALISIHSLRMEGDSVLSQSWFASLPFQSTPSAWRETMLLLVWSSRSSPISIHSLRMEGDQTASAIILARRHFNPLPPHGGRRHRTYRRMRGKKYFNPLPPHGGRLFQQPIDLYPNIFQSTPSAWRETAKLHRKAFFISPILVQSCKKGCKRLHSAPEKMVFFEKREKNLVRNLQHLSVRL